MVCEKCGNMIQAGEKFCMKCGNSMEPEQQLNKTYEEKKMQVESEAEGSAGGKGGSKVLSVMLCILIVLLGVSASTIFVVRHAVSEEEVENLVDEVDISEIKVGFLMGGSKTTTLAETVSGFGQKYFDNALTSKDAAKIMDEKFIRKFVSKKLNDYVEDIFYETGDGIIEEDELESLLEKNAEKMQEITGLYFGEEEISFLMKEMQTDDALKNTDLSAYRDENPAPFSLVKNLLSYWLMSLFLILAVLLIVYIFYLQKKKIKGFFYLGVSVIAVGVTEFVLAALVSRLGVELNGTISFGRKFWQLLFEPVRTMGTSIGIVLVIAGIVCLLIYFIPQAIRNKKNGAVVKMRP